MAEIGNMTTQIKVLHENLVKQLSSLDEDNVGIGGIEFSRKKLLAALKLQKNADVMTITYGLMSWHYDYSYHAEETKHERYKTGDGLYDYSWREVTTPASWEYKPYTKEPTPCIQFELSANGVKQIMRFGHAPVRNKAGNIETKHLNFVDYQEKETVKPVLSGIPLDTAELIRALQFAVARTTPDESRPVLCCVLFDCGNNTLKVIAADGFRLAVATMAAPGIATDKILIDQQEIIKLVKFLKGSTIGRGKGKYYPDVFLSRSQDNNEVYFATESGKITLNHCMYTFPAYEQLTPTSGTVVEFVASQLLTTVKSVSEFSRDGSGIIRLQFKQWNDAGKIIVSARSEESDTVAECDSKFPDAERKIGVNVKYLTECLASMGDDVITLQLTEPSCPMVFQNKELGFLEVVMPMFVAWSNTDDVKITPKIEPEPEDIEESEPELTAEDNEHLNECDRQTVGV